MNENTTLVQPFTKLFASNVTSAAAIIPPVMTSVEPTGDGIFVNGATEGFNQLLFAFFGQQNASADNGTFAARITSWRVFSGLWLPTPLLTLTLTQGLMNGATGLSINAQNYMVDTIAANNAYTTAYELISPADDTMALLKLDIFGSAKIQVQLQKLTGGGGNALASGY